MLSNLINLEQTLLQAIAFKLVLQQIPYRGVFGGDGMVSLKNLPLISIALEDGEEIVSSIKKGLKLQKVESAAFETIFGKVREFDITQFVGGRLLEKHFEEEHLLMSINGKLVEKGNMGYKGDILVSLSRAESALGGTLIKGTASGEVVVKARIVSYKKK